MSSNGKLNTKSINLLTQPKTCTKCSEKVVKHAYHIMCIPCAQLNKVCPKCGQQEELVPKVATVEEQQKLDSEMRQTLKSLSERKRRTFLRYMNSNKKVNGKADGDGDGDADGDGVGEKPSKEELIAKLDALKVDDADGDYDEFSDLGSDFDD